MENLTYEEYRNIAQDGDIIFFHGSNRSWLQKIIMFTTNSSYCHVAIGFWVLINDQRHLMVVEAQGGTSRRILTASYYQDRKMDILRAPLPWSSYCDKALSQIGVAKYNYIDAIYVGIREFVWNKTGLRLPFLNNCGEICSEFVARLMELPEVSISPGELHEKLRVLYPQY